MIMNEFIGGSSGRSVKYGPSVTECNNAPNGATVILKVSKYGSTNVTYGTITLVKSNNIWQLVSIAVRGTTNELILGGCQTAAITLSSGKINGSITVVKSTGSALSQGTISVLSIEYTESILISP